MLDRYRHSISGTIQSITGYIFSIWYYNILSIPGPRENFIIIHIWYVMFTIFLSLIYQIEKHTNIKKSNTYKNNILYKIIFNIGIFLTLLLLLLTFVPFIRDIIPL